MKNVLRSAFGGIVAAVIAVVAQAADLPPGAFSAGKVLGDVTYKLAGTSQYLALTPGTALPQGATIKTGSGSLVMVKFSNGATATIRPDSEVEITKFQQEVFSGSFSSEEPSISKTEIKVINGDVVSKVTKLKPGSSYVVNTPVGAAGVRGTIFQVTYNASTGDYSVRTLEGAVVFSKVGGETTTIRPGETYNGVRIEPLTDAQITAIESAIQGDIDSKSSVISSSSTAPGATGPTFPDVDTSINVSVN